MTTDIRWTRWGRANGPETTVILTLGGHLDGRADRVVGVFATEADARSERADELALAILSEKALSPNQRADAEHNSEVLGLPDSGE
jgi:hypothetical protein